MTGSSDFGAQGSCSSLIADFLLEHRSERLQRSLTIVEDLLVREALEAFLIDEQMLHKGEAGAPFHAALAELRRSVRGDPALAPLLETLSATGAALVARLNRSEHAALIMREHRIMLAEDQRVSDIALDSFRTAARELLINEMGDRIVIDSGAPVLRCDGGAQVQCWVFVSDSEREELNEVTDG